jgi:hypothetical protein
LEWLLLRSLLKCLVLLAWIARELGLLLLGLLEIVLRLPRKACKLRLHWTASKSSRLRRQSSLKATWLLAIRLLLLLLLLAILRLPRSGAVAAP